MPDRLVAIVHKSDHSRVLQIGFHNYDLIDGRMILSGDATMPVGKLLSKLAKSTDLLLKGEVAQQYGALCCLGKRKQGDLQVLLVTTRDTGRWVIPKGWPMNGKEPHQVAEREALEEAGVKGKAGKKPIGYYTYMKRLADGTEVPCVVQVHTLKVDEQLEEFKEKGQRQAI